MSVRVDCSAYNVGDIPTHLLLTHFSPLLSPLTAGITYPHLISRKFLIAKIDDGLQENRVHLI